MKNLLQYFITKEDNKEITREMTRTNGDRISQTTKVTTRYYDIPQDIKEIVQREIKESLLVDKHSQLLKNKEL